MITNKARTTNYRRHRIAQFMLVPIIALLLAKCASFDDSLTDLAGRSTVTTSATPTTISNSSASLNRTVTARTVTITRRFDTPTPTLTLEKTATPISTADSTATAFFTPTPNPFPTLERIGELGFTAGHQLAVSTNDLLATARIADPSEIIQIYDMLTGTIVQEILKPEAPIVGTKSLTFSPDGFYLAAGGSEQTVYIWETDSGELIHESSLSGPIFKVAFSSDGQLLAAASPGVMGHLIVLELGQEGHFEKLVELEYVTALDIAFVPGSSLLAIALDYPNNEIAPNGVVLLWNIQSGQIETVFTGSFADGVAVSPDSQTLAAYVDGHLRLWNIQDQVETAVKEVGPGQDLIFSPDGKLVARVQGMFGGSGVITVWNIRGELVAQVMQERTSHIAFTRDGRLLSANISEFVQIWMVPP